jgi:hypothetical protein
MKVKVFGVHGVRQEPPPAPKKPHPVFPRPMACVVCGKTIPVRSVTTLHPESPEFLALPAGAWIGQVQGDAQPEVILGCSERCVQALLENGG